MRPDLEAIEARVKATTPGPWMTCNPESAFKNWPIGFFSLGRDEEAQPKNWAVSTDHVRASEMTSGGSKEDAEFIAHARQDIPTLLAYIRHLEAAGSAQAPAQAIAGALFDFAGFLTTHPEVIPVGASALSSPMVDRLTEWAKRRGLPLEGAAVDTWRMDPAPAAPALPFRVTEDEGGLVVEDAAGKMVFSASHGSNALDIWNTSPEAMKEALFTLGRAFLRAPEPSGTPSETPEKGGAA